MNGVHGEVDGVLLKKDQKEVSVVRNPTRRNGGIAIQEAVDMNERGGICSLDQKYNVLQKEDGDGLTAG